MKKMFTSLPIFTLAPSLSIGLLMSDMIEETRPANLFGFSACEIDGHPVICQSAKLSTLLGGNLLWLRESGSKKLLSIIDEFEKPDCSRRKTIAHCPSLGVKVDCWVYSQPDLPLEFSPWKGSYNEKMRMPWDG